MVVRDAFPDLTSQTSKAREVLARHADELRMRFGLRQVSVGYLRSEERLTAEIGIVCFVAPGEDARGLEEVPKEIEGVPVQIVRMGEKFSPR